MDTNVLDWLEVTAAACPDKPAFLDEDSAVTFADVRREARIIGTAAARLRAGRKAPIAVMSGRNAHTPAVFLGAVYAGCCYAPMDGTMPVHRLNSILNTLDTDLMIEDLKALKRGETIHCPVYDYAIHNRTDETVEIKPTKVVIVEVNENMPRCLGGMENCVHISKVSGIVEGSNPPIGQMAAAGPASEVDLKVANLVVPLIPNGACLQLGIGGMPNAIGSLIAQSDLKDLGVHTEMYVDAFVDIAKAGKITGAHKQLDKGRQVYAFGAGTKKMYDYLDNNPECMSAPVDYTNDIRSISALDNFISINNAVDIDLFGQVNAESAGVKHISGAGGQLDFVLGAYLSKGGKSFICLSSTFMNKKTGKLESRIRPTLENGSIITDTRANLHYLCTEYGCVNLKGLTSWEKAEALISVAHPDFREQLIAEADKMHIWRRSNKR